MLVYYTTTSPPFSALGPPSVNDAGAIAFWARGNSAGIYVTDRDTLRTIADGTGPLSFDTSLPETQRPAINNHGAVAFVADVKAGGRGIFSSAGGFLSRIADTSGPFRDFGNSILLNDAGLVGFTAGLKSGGEGIFTGPDAVADKVIAGGDPLFGSTVDAVGGIPGLNNRSQFAFNYHLTSGTSGVAIASKMAPLGEANGGGLAGFDDLLVLAQHYGGPGGLAEGDFNADGNVGFDDLLILAQHYGDVAHPQRAWPEGGVNAESSSFAQVPERGTVLILGMSALIHVRLQRAPRGAPHLTAR